MQYNKIFITILLLVIYKSGFSQEILTKDTAVTLALENDEYILPMHRNLGVFTTRKIPLHRLFAQWQGKANCGLYFERR